MPPVKTFEYEAWVCPLRYVQVDAHEEDATVLTGTIEECGAELHIVWTFSWPVPTGGDVRSYNGMEVAANAYTTGWDVVCEEGHMLAKHSRSAEDYAEDIDVARVMEAIGARLRPGS